ncbi:enhanced serine sensitivity protein SseB C-terminal domain-containing protein [Flavobacterium sp. RHBU_24]|uniref:enhanced serine sensitivity protein SseB C-terminal domain-containing protein n=1 Tax=Flavobacterium sp. RHBU_24 TaxID=3391185 RepID=UPI0039847490
MGLFDFFKKKNPPQEHPLTPFEEIMKKASGDVAYRAAFYKELIANKLTVITSGDEPYQEGEKVLREATIVGIYSYADGRIPVFTSPGRIMDKNIIKERVRFMEMNATDLLKIIGGATILLNPYSDFGKELLPAEVKRILDGTILGSHKQMVMEKDTQVRIGQPAVYPHDIVNNLCRLYKERPTVKAAYIAWIHYPESNEPPHYIFALDISGDKSEVFSETGFIAKQSLKPEEFIDIVKLSSSGEGIDNYFLSQEPFYRS